MAKTSTEHAGHSGVRPHFQPVLPLHQQLHWLSACDPFTSWRSSFMRLITFTGILVILSHPWLSTDTCTMIIQQTVTPSKAHGSSIISENFQHQCPHCSLSLSVWNSLLHNCKSLQLLSTLNCNLKSCLILPTVSLNSQPVSAIACLQFACDTWHYCSIDWLWWNFSQHNLKLWLGNMV